MILRVSRSAVKGKVRIPGSKSHTIRAIFIASLARGRSIIEKPLISSDAMAAVEACKSMGAAIDILEDGFYIDGFGAFPKVPDDIINVDNSGTTLCFAFASAALAEGYTVFTGDQQIRRRPLEPLIGAVNSLGGTAFSTRNNGAAPAVVKGRLAGGFTTVDAVSSQYLSALLLNCPVIENDTTIELTRLYEVPYAEMTLWWLDKQGIRYENHDLKQLYIEGGQKYKPFKEAIPGDFSTATFLAVLSAISGQELILDNLDMNDPQGDKMVFSILEDMGAKVTYGGDSIKIKGDKLRGREIDMNSIPDALPAMAVAGCFAEGETKLFNVAQARLKETDRISVICAELKKMGADIEELPDGLIVRNSKLSGGMVKGHGDHRIVMALAVAGLNADGDTIIDTAEAINVTFPEFVSTINACGGKMGLI